MVKSVREVTGDLLLFIDGRASLARISQRQRPPFPGTTLLQVPYSRHNTVRQMNERLACASRQFTVM